MNVIFWALSVLGCEREVTLKVSIHDEREPPIAYGEELGPMSDQLYSLVYTRCLRCHSDWGEYRNEVEENIVNLGLAQLGEPEESVFYQKLLENPLHGSQMPPQFSPINSQILIHIENWIRLGAGDNESFQVHVVPPYQAYCADCHQGYTNGSIHPDAIYEALLNREVDGQQLVSPNNPDLSLFYLKMTDPPSGELMPLSYPLFSESELHLAADWVRGTE